MDESFEIPVSFKDRELLFTARLLSFGYIHKFQVNVDGQELFFEQDDSGEYRAVVASANLMEAKKINVELLEAIAASIESLLK